MAFAELINDLYKENFKYVERIDELEKQLQENTIAMEKANEYLQLANEENEQLIKALEKIANQTETEILFTQVGSARQIAIAALKKDQ